MFSTYLQANLSGFDILIDRTSDSFPINLAKYEFPFSDGVQIDNLGNGARTVELRCHFQNASYVNFESFVAEIRTNKIFQLNHPIFGIIAGRIENIRVEQDNLKDNGIVSLTFCEQKYDVNIILSTINLKIETDIVDFIEDFQSAYQVSIDNKTALTKIIEKASPLYAQFSEFDAEIRKKIIQISDAIDVMNEFLSDVVAPLDSIAELVEWVSTLPAYVLEVINDVVSRVITSVNTITMAPSVFIKSCFSQIQELKENIISVCPNVSLCNSITETLENALAQQCSNEVAKKYTEDTENYNEFKLQANDLKFDDLGNYISTQPQVTNFLNNKELENSLYLIREKLNIGINYDPENLAYINSRLASELKKYIDKIKMERVKLYDITISGSYNNAYTIFKSKNIPESYFEKIMAINYKIENPCFINGNFTLIEV